MSTPRYTVSPAAPLRHAPFTPFTTLIGPDLHFSDQQSFNIFCCNLIEDWKEALPTAPHRTGSLFDAHLGKISREEPNTIQTPWGGVSIIKHVHPQVEKYLVVKQGGYLAFEKHTRKEETISVIEGCGLLLYRAEGAAPTQISLVPLIPNSRYEFRPGQEHCIVGTENLLAFETSVDPLGMDKDLVFLFTPS